MLKSSFLPIPYRIREEDVRRGRKKGGRAEQFRSGRPMDCNALVVPQNTNAQPIRSLVESQIRQSKKITKVSLHSRAIVSTISSLRAVESN